jgi:hypothetical protein
MAVNNHPGRGELGIATRFPAPHAPSGDYLNSEINALALDFLASIGTPVSPQMLEPTPCSI